MRRAGELKRQCQLSGGDYQGAKGGTVPLAVARFSIGSQNKSAPVHFIIEWDTPIVMDGAVKAKVDKMWGELGL